MENFPFPLLGAKQQCGRLSLQAQGPHTFPEKGEAGEAVWSSRSRPQHLVGRVDGCVLGWVGGGNTMKMGRGRGR